MKSTFVLSFAFAAAIAATPTLAQERAASAPAGAASAMSTDCGRTAVMAHDHGNFHKAQAPTSKPQSMPCGESDPASTSGKAKPAHDHNKFHKNQ